MNPARVGLKLALQHAGIPEVRLQTFSDRFNVQKRVYLIQLFGLDLGYRFGWYLRGPYCRGLTDDAFILKEELESGDREHENFYLADDALAGIERAKQLWQVPREALIDQNRWLELLASLHYLRHIAYWAPNAVKGFEECFAALIKSKPQFADKRSVAERAWESLAGVGLIAAKTVA